MERRPWEGVLALGLAEPARLVHRSEEPPRPATWAPVPDDLHPRIASALRRTGVERLYGHQAAVWRAAAEGRHVGVVTGTASGKTLAYGLPVLQALLADPNARALYLAPTKALAQDQARGLLGLGLGRDLRPALYDGDTDRDARARARRHANLLLTNPDMVHAGVCPGHARWGDVLANLTHVVVDEAHVYRGVFGAHVGNVLRRLRRVCALYGAAPRFLLASATVANPEEAMAALTGLDVHVVHEDGAARPGRTLALWNPTLLDPATGERASPLAEAAALVAMLVAEGQRVICFAGSRRGVEVLHRMLRDAVGQRVPAARDRVAPYRAGYTAEQRRALEARLRSGDLLAVVATSALELGIDVGGLDAAVVVGFPGTVAALRQRFGRAGRRAHGLALLVAGPDALDQFLVRHPDVLAGRPVEAVVLDPTSPEVLEGHVACAAHEAPIRARDATILGPGAVEQAERLAAGGTLTRTPAGLAWTRPEAPTDRVSLRSSTVEAVTVVDGATGTLLGTVEAPRASRTVHPGAVYLHLGEAWEVTSLDLAERVALVRPFEGDWYTETEIAGEHVVEHVDEVDHRGPVALFRGRVCVTERVRGFRRRRQRDGQVLDRAPLDGPAETFATQALWATVDPTLLEEEPDPLGALHAAEHVLIAVLPLHAMCDRWDLGGLSTPLHPDTGRPTIFVHDAHPGGVGLTRRGHATFGALARDALDVVRLCPCADGCPACVQSPKCGNLNEPLSKAGAVRLLTRLAGAFA